MDYPIMFTKVKSPSKQALSEMGKYGQPLRLMQKTASVNSRIIKDDASTERQKQIYSDFFVPREVRENQVAPDYY